MHEPRVAAAVHAFEQWSGRRAEHVDVLVGGLRNSMVRVDEWIVRTYIADPSAVEREVVVLRLLAGVAPVPQLEHIDLHVPCIIVRYIEGAPFQQLDAPGRRRAAASIGHALARIGTIDPTGLAAERPDLAAAFDSEILRARLGALAPAVDDIAKIELPTDTRLVHGDFRKWNLLVRDDRCVGIIDWERVHVGSPLEDLGLLLRYERDRDPRFGAELAAGFVAGGGVLAGSWRRTARIRDLAAMCRSLADPALPEAVTAELLAVVRGSLEDLVS